MVFGKAKSTPARNFFLYSLMFIALYVSAFSFAGSVWQLINLYVPDQLAQAENYGYTNEFYLDNLRGFLSALIVGVPLYYGLARYVSLAQKKDKAMVDSAIRKWLTYITLLVGAVVVLVTLIVTVNKLLSGETTLRFILRALDVLAVASGVFGYHLWDIRRS